MRAPTNEKGPSASDARALENNTNESPDFAVDDQSRQAKTFATLQAQAALAGHVLQRLADGTYTLSRWGAYSELPTLREVGDLLRRMGSQT